jgi:hypothetical protein
MRQLRIIGLVMLAYGAVMLLLLFTPWKEWAANHSIAHLVSRTDRRIDNEVHGSVDMPLSIAGDVVMMFAGLWFAFLVPRQFQKYGFGGSPAATPPAPQPPLVQPGRPLPPPQLPGH